MAHVLTEKSLLLEFLLFLYVVFIAFISFIDDIESQDINCKIDDSLSIHFRVNSVNISVDSLLFLSSYLADTSLNNLCGLINC